MFAALLVLIGTALVALTLGSWQPRARLGRLAALLGTASALAVALWLEGLQGGGVAGRPVEWPGFLFWLGKSPYRSDLLSASLGAWCLLLGALWLLRSWASERWRMPVEDPRSAGVSTAAGVLVIAALYSIAHTWDLMVFTAQMLLLLPLVWLLNVSEINNRGRSAPNAPHAAFALGASVLCLLAAALLIGRTTGGEYNLAELTLAALTRGPLSLIVLGIALWIGFSPVTGWNTRDLPETSVALVQGLVVGVPAAVLLLRLEGLVSAQGLAGSVPEGWSTFTQAIAWAGGATALVAGAGSMLAAGTSRWSSLLTAHAMGLVALALGLDTPLSRIAALAILLAFSVARIALDLVESEPVSAIGRPARAVAAFSLAAAPLTGGFVGVWLLGISLSQSARPSSPLVLLGAALLSATGAALHFGSKPSGLSPDPPSYITHHVSRFTFYASLTCALAIVVGGIAPGLWLGYVGEMASVAGARPAVELAWTGIGAGMLLLPAPLLGLAALAIAAIGWAITQWTRSGATPSSALLPTALNRLTSRPTGKPSSLIPHPSSLLWWLSLVWLEEGVRGLGVLLARLAARIGLGLGRLEGRYYLPLVLILALIALLAATR